MLYSLKPRLAALKETNRGRNEVGISRSLAMSQRVSSYIPSAGNAQVVAPRFRRPGAASAALHRHVEHQTDVPDIGFRKVFEHRYEIAELVVVGVAEPAADWNCVLWMEDV